MVEGVIRKRDADDYNEKIATGTIELLVQKLEVLNIVGSMREQYNKIIRWKMLGWRVAIPF